MRATPAILVGLGALVATSGLVPSSSAQAAGPTVVINELHYNPEDDNPASEFIELYNTTGSTVNLSGWCIDGIDYCFGGGRSIAAKGYLVVGGGEYDGALSNGGEDIALLDASDTTIDALEYDDKEEWPALADGDGHSLQRRDTASTTDDPGNWISAPPTRGAKNAQTGSGLLPSFSDVEHTEYPSAGTPIVVTAELDHASSATLQYRVGFGSTKSIAMSESGGEFTATIPGQAAGSLVRYRLTASTGGRTGTWPRQGDGSGWRGTTVRRSIDTELPVFEIFMPDDTYNTMVADLSLSGDDGYPMIFAYEGQVFDNARIRVKGQVSRTFPKKKFKIILPPGYDLEDDDLFEDDVDEFAIHSSWSDRSFLRETLSSEFMTAADARGAQQAFPVRIERNGQFYGLYSYVEQPDGTYRDRYDYDDSEVYEVGPDNIFGLLAPGDATRSQSSLRARYDKETFEYLDDGRLRDFIATVNAISGVSERNWIYDHVDIPSVVNVLAASMVIQNQDWGHKNYRLVFDEYGRVGITQNDYDLTFGRRWSNTSGALDTRVYVGGAFEHPGGPFFETFFFDAELSAMIKRRVRTLTEEQLNPNRLYERIVELAAEVRTEAVLDRARWGTYGGSADPTDEAVRIVNSFATPQYNRLLGSYASQGRVASTTQPAKPAVSIQAVNYSGVEHVIVRNDSGDTVDISGFEIPEIDLDVPGGTVLLPGRTAIFLHEDVERTASAYRGHLVAGFFDESVRDADRLRLRNRKGDVVHEWTLVPPGRQTEFEGLANRSALVGLVTVATAAAGHLEVLPCGQAPGSSSNLNADGPGQIRAGMALTRFDADGEACIYNHAATHMVADIQGYLAETAIDDIPDARLLDTRKTTTPPARGTTRITGGRPGETGIVNITLVNTRNAGHVGVTSCSATSPPETSNINWTRSGMIIATTAFVEFDADGAFCLWNYDVTDLVIDIQGYLEAGAFDDVADDRLIDTRNGNRPAAMSSTKVTGRPNSTAVVSIVAAAPDDRGHLQVHNCATKPGATSNVNYDQGGLTIAGLATMRFDAKGEACVYTHAATDFIVDLQGYFADGAFDDIVDDRALDTRR